jgi:hypothetical protein
MAYIVDYMAHDPVGNVEGQLTCYDAEALAEAEKNGMLFIAVMSDGTREVVKASEVSEPSSRGQDFVFVQPTYVDKRTAATVACFEALSAIVDPQPAAADETGEEADAVDPVDPVEAFRVALSALKALEATE